MQTIAVTINGKICIPLEIQEETSVNDIEAICLNHPEVQSVLGDRQIFKFVHVPGKITNILTRDHYAIF